MGAWRFKLAEAALTHRPTTRSSGPGTSTDATHRRGDQTRGHQRAMAIGPERRRPMDANHTAVLEFTKRKLRRPAPTTHWRPLSNGAGYWLAASVVGLGLYASLTPSPLYGIYRVLWHFSPLTLTLIYATYALGVLTSLLLVGRASDDVGRR